MDLDKILPEIGEFGRYQKYVVWFILLPGAFPCGFHAYNQLFMAATPEHWCKYPDSNSTHDFDKNDSIPVEYKGDIAKYSSCTRYDFGNESYPNSRRIIACDDGWIFDHSKYQNTITTEWELVCDKDLLPTLALILLGAGGLVGSYIFGYIQDGLGRKPAFFIYLAINCVFGVATAFATSFTMWVLFRIGVGFTVPAILCTPYVLAIELVGPQYRTLVTILVNIAYSLALVGLAVIVWAVRDWRLLALTTSVPFLALFAFWCMLPESPRWLLAKGKFKEAERILTKMARINGKSVNVKELLQLQAKLQDQKTSSLKQRNYGISDLFKYPRLRWKTVIVTFIWFTNTSVYVGLSYYAPALGGDEFLNFFLAGAVELPTYLFLWPALERLGRRWTLCASMVVGGAACIATFLVQNDSLITMGLYCVGKMGISSSFVVLPLMASELYPTVVRGLGMSLSSVMGMLGPVFIPLVNYLGTDMLTLPLIIMGTMLVLGGICSLLLPETLNKHLPQTLLDGEKVGLNCLECSTAPQIDLRQDDYSDI